MTHAELVWSTPTEWIDDVVGMVRLCVGEHRVAHLLEHPPSHVLSSDLHWLDGRHSSEAGQHPVSVALSHLLAKRYSTVRAFHASRVKDPQSYVKNGISPMNVHLFELRARELFATDRDVSVRRSFLAALRSMRSKYSERDERVFLYVDEAHLLKYCGHLLVYGSEYILRFADELNRERSHKHDVRPVLTQCGQPTMFVCSVPLLQIAPRVLVEFASILIGEAFRCRLGLQSAPRSRRFGLVLAESLSAACIMSWYHPSEINDPELCLQCLDRRTCSDVTNPVNDPDRGAQE